MAETPTATTERKISLRMIWRFASRAVLFLVILYVGTLGLLTLIETKLIYPAPPVTRGDWSPDWLDHEEVWVPSAAGNRLHGWICQHPSPKHVILLFHGNGEHLGYLADELHELCESYSATVMAFDYRGYGLSPGKPFEAGILTDAVSVHEWLAERVQKSPNEIVLWGRSLGGAVAIHCAATSGAKTLVLDRTFSSMVDVANSHYPWLPVKTLLQNRYPSVERIASYHGPLVQVHGTDDALVDLEFGKRLFAAANSEPKHFIEAEGLGHNEPWPREVEDEVHAFVVGNR